MKIILILAFVLTGISAGTGVAGELDDESSVTNRQIKGTIILRVDKRNRKADYVKTDTVMSSKEKAKTFVKTAKFQRVPASKIKSELDQSGGSSSWYFYDRGGFNRGYDPGYGRGGYDRGYDPGYGRGGYDRGYDPGYGRGGYGNYYNPYCNYYGANYQSYYYYNNSYYDYYYYGDCYWNRGRGCGY